MQCGVSGWNRGGRQVTTPPPTSDLHTRISSLPPSRRFSGPDYDPALDATRLSHQLVRLYTLMADGDWRTLREIAAETGIPESSASAQLRHLRKPKFGAYQVDKRRRGERSDGLFEYRVWRPVSGTQGLLL